MPTSHQAYCQHKLMGHSDAAKRIADTYNLHRIGSGEGAIGKWFAAALHDGRTDDTLYDTKQQATRFQHHNEQWYTFIKVGPHGMTACDAEIMLKVARAAYDNGMRLADPQDRNGGKDIIKRLTAEDQRAQARGKNTNLLMPWEA